MKEFVDDLREECCWGCGRKLDKDSQPIFIEQKYTHEQEEYKCLDRKETIYLSLCESCGKQIREDIWDVFNDILNNQNHTTKNKKRKQKADFIWYVKIVGGNRRLEQLSS